MPKGPRGEVRENPHTGERSTVIVAAEDAQGAWLQVRHVAPRPTVMDVAHVQPARTEVFTVARGRLRFTVDGEAYVVIAGDTIKIEARQVHSFENVSDGEMVLRQDVRPAGRQQEVA